MPLKIRLVYTHGDVSEALDFLLKCMLISNDIETLPDMGLMTVNGFSGLHESGEIRTYVFPLYNDFAPSSGSPQHLGPSLRAMERINASGIPFTYQNGAYDNFWLVRYGLPVFNWAYDSMTMFWSIWPELPKRLDFISSILLDDYVYWKGDRKSDDFPTYLEYNGKDCDRTLRNTIKLIELLLTDERARTNFAYAHRRVLAALGMSMRGMRADVERLAEHGVALAKDAEEKLARLRYLVADPDFNPSSVPQKSRLFYSVLGARPRSAKGRFVKTIEEASTGAVALRAMRAEHPLFRRVVNATLDAIEPAKQISNVIGIKLARWPTQTRFYTGYNGVGTTTTRFSSTSAPIGVGTNAQNIRATYRDWLTADPAPQEESGPDDFLLDIDLSAGDDVFVTFESGDPKKIALFRSGKDSHSENATLFFPNWNYDDIVKGKRAGEVRIVHPITGIRQISKKLSHGCNYLMAGLTLLMTAGREAIVAAAKEVGYSDAGYWTQEKLADFCVSRELLYRGHYTRFAREGADSWYTDLQRELIATGGFTTPFQYYQRFLGDRRDQNVLRAVAATAGQAGTAGRINMALDEFTFGIIPPRFRDGPNPDGGRVPLPISRREFGTSLRLQTHDSFTFNVNPRHPEWKEGIRRIFAVMARPVVIRNKLTGELEEFVVRTESNVGWRWGKKMVELKRNDVESVQLALQ